MRYIDDQHIYVNDDGEVYTSVTKLIKKYEPAKDWQKIAENYAKKKKKKVEEVQADWNKKKQDSLDRGISIHKTKEELLLSEPVFVDGEPLTVFPSPLVDGIKVAGTLKLTQGIYPEIPIYSHRYKVAGQPDYVLVKDGFIHIKDYKTNKQIKKESYKDWTKKGQHEMLLFPVNNFMNADFWKYSLQINLYMYILLSHNPNLKLGEMEIIHISHDTDFFGEPIIINYKVDNYQEPVFNLLEHFKATSDDAT